jgi:PAS domain S-box-containing protein
MDKKTIQILLFEDNPGDARLFREYLREADLVQVELDHFELLETGLAHLARKKPDVILLDLGLPDSQGLETFRAVFAKVHDVPIVVLTGLNDSEQAVEAVREGAQDYLVKGEISGGLLVRAIRYAIERKRAELELIMLSMAVDNSSEAIFMTEREGVITFVNPGFTSIYGYTADEIIGKKTPRILKSGVMKTESYAAFWQTLLNGQEVKGQWINKTKDGHLLNIEGSVNPILNEQKEIIGFLSIQRDITERKRAEKELMESKALVDAIVENVPLMIFLKEATDLRFVILNRAGEELLGYNRKELLGKNDLDLFPAEQAAHFMAKDREMLDREGGMLDIPEEPIQTAMKDQRLLHTRKVCIRGADGDTEYLLGISEDITERKRAEEEIIQLNAHLEKRVEERTRELGDAQEKLVRQEKLAVLGQLAGGVGHELRNPLSVINTSIYYLKLAQPEAGEKIKQHHAMIEQEVHNAEKIISDLLDFARVVSSDRKPVAVSDLVQHVLTRFPAPASVEVALEIPDDLTKVFADLRQVEQVLGNLIVNACQAMKDGGMLTISAHRNKEMVAIAVKDTGVGILPDNMEKLFEPLFTTKAKGIGLGLAVSRKLAEANDGRIEVQSEPGKGSTFTLILPVEGR